MTIPFSYFAAAVAAGSGNEVPAGIFIPRSDLPGLTSDAELSDANKEPKAAYSVANKIFSSLNGISSKLGLSVSRPNPTGAGTDRINQQIALSAQYMVNHATNAVSPLPTPGSGAGKVTVNQVFPNAAVVAEEGAISGAGIVIPNSFITGYGGSAVANVNAADARSLITAVMYGIVSTIATAPAVVAASRGSAVGLVPTADFTGANATTGLTADDLPLRSFFSLTFTLTMQLLLNQDSQTFDVVTA
jgi:hypothetical protein